MLVQNIDFYIFFIKLNIIGICKIPKKKQIKFKKFICFFNIFFFSSFTPIHIYHIFEKKL